MTFSLFCCLKGIQTHYSEYTLNQKLQVYKLLLAKT